MNVLYVHQHFNTPSGATGTRSYFMAKALLARGHRVTMICGSYGTTGLTSHFVNGIRRGYVEGIYVIELNLPYSNSDNFVKRSVTFGKFVLGGLGFVFREKYDILFATSTPLTTGVFGIFARWIRQKKFVFEVRDLWPELPKAMGVITNPLILFLMSCLEWTAYHSANHLIGLSPGIVDGIAKHGVSQEKITLVPNGCDLEIFHNRPKALLEPIVGSNKFIAIYAGTIGLANHLYSLIDLAEELQFRGNINIVILIVGAGKLKPELIEHKNRRNLKNIVFHDQVSKYELASIFASCDIGLQILKDIPSFYNGTSPNKFFDYISASLPVLTNYPGWIAEIIQNHQCGLVAPPNDANKFADLLEFASANPEILSKMSKNSLALAKHKFDRKILAKKWINALHLGQN